MTSTQQKFELIIKARTQQAVAEIKKSASAVRDGFTRAKLSGLAFNKTMAAGKSSASALTGQIRMLIGAVVGVSALSKATEIIKAGDAAAFSMAQSVMAANREFDDVGSLRIWEANIQRLSKELKIYSESSLKNAVSRTVDMTKRLGLNAAQMQEVIQRSADLGAGKTDLEGAIERVTAALRGEAEASEYLGLTLNETYVRSWYEASELYDKAWKDLTDLEKAQIRYNVFLSQTEQLQGRAAASADTFGGALALVRKEIEDAITNNESVAESVAQIATVLRENAADIGEIASGMLSAAAAVIQFAIDYKEMLLAIGGTAVATTLIGKLVTVVKALNTAFAVLTGLSVIQWVTSLRVALNAAAGQMTGLSIAFKGFIAFAAAEGIYNIGRLVKVLWDWVAASRELKAAQDALAGQKAWIDPQIAKKLEEISAQTGIVIQSFEQFNALLKKNVIQYNKQTGEYFKTPEKKKKTVSTKELTDAERSKIADDQKRLENQLAIELLEIAGKKWAALKEQAYQHYQEQQQAAHGNAKLLAEAQSLYAQTITDINKQALDEAAEKSAAIEDARRQSALDRLKAYTETGLAQLESIYKQGEVSLASFFDQRSALIEKQAQAEIDALKAQAAATTDQSEQIRLQAEIYEKQQALQRSLLELAGQRAAAEKAVADNQRQAIKILENLRDRTTDTIGIDAAYTIEQAEMDQRHQDEIRRLTELRATETQINDAYRMQELEKDQLLADQQQRIFEQRLQNTADIAGGVSDIFQSLYELTGEKQKEFFYLSKAAALAEAVMNTAAAVTKALKEGGPFAGPAMAAIMAAKGAVEIATISAQKLWAGGMVGGSSPTDTADNVPIWATAGEFMHPVSTVKYYGLQAMEAIRRKMIPREILAGLNFQVPQLTPSYHLAQGGPVPSGAAYTISVPVSISGNHADRLARVLPGEIEETVRRVMRQELR